MSSPKPSMPDPGVLWHHFSAFVQEETTWAEAEFGQDFEEGLAHSFESRDGVEFGMSCEGRDDDLNFHVLFGQEDAVQAQGFLPWFLKQRGTTSKTAYCC